MTCSIVPAAATESARNITQPTSATINTYRCRSGVGQNEILAPRPTASNARNALEYPAHNATVQPPPYQNPSSTKPVRILGSSRSVGASRHWKRKVVAQPGDRRHVPAAPELPHRVG